MFWGQHPGKENTYVSHFIAFSWVVSYEDKREISLFPSWTEAGEIIIGVCQSVCMFLWLFLCFFVCQLHPGLSPGDAYEGSIR